MNSRLKVALLLLLLAVICGVTLLLTSCSKRSIPSTAPKPVLQAWVYVTGPSMGLQPRFVEAQIGFAYDSLQTGDTVIFWDYTRATPTLTHHRLVAKQLGNWIAQGDNTATNPTADRPWVTPDNYIARTTGRSVTTLSVP